MSLAVVAQTTSISADADAEITCVPNSSGSSWLIAFVSWRVVDGSAPPVNLGDFSRNIWQLLYTPVMHSWALNTTAQVYTQVWACPAVRYDGWNYLNVYVAAMAITASDVGTVTVNVVEISGMANGWITVDSVVRNTATAATTMSLAIPTPAADCLVLAVAATDNATGTVSNTGTLTGLTQVVGTAPSVTCTSAWKEATTAQTASWSSTVACDWAAVAVAIRVTGVLPVQPNSTWPITQFLVGLGYQAATNLNYVTWTDQSTRLVGGSDSSQLSGTRGIPYDQQEANSEQSTLTIRNDDGAYTPRTPGAGPASANGTTGTFVMTTANAAGINVGDFFQLFTAAGALKEFTVFQVTAVTVAGAATTVTFLQADGTGVALAATVTGDIYAGIQIDLDIPFQLVMYWNGKLYPVLTGWLYDLNLTWSDPHWGDVAADASDALASLANTDNPSWLRKEILRRNPTHYWPLGDPAGATVAQNASGVSLTQLNLVTSKFGAGTSGNEVAAFGTSTQGIVVSDITPTGSKNSLLGDPGTGLGISGLTAADMTAKQGFALIGNGTDFPPIGPGITVFGFSYLQNSDATIINSSGVSPTVFILRNGNPGQGAAGGSVIKLSVSATNSAAIVTVWDQTTHAATTTTTAWPMTQFLQSWSLTFNRTSWTLHMNGAVHGTGTCNLTSAFNEISVGGEADQFYNGNCYSAIHAHIAIFARQLTAQETTNLDAVLSFGRIYDTHFRAFETTGNRIARALNSTGVNLPRVITKSDVICSVEDGGDSTVADLATHVTEYEDGLWFTDALGQLQFRSAAATYHQVPKAILGDRPDLGEIPYEAGQEYTLDKQIMYNNIQVNNTALTNIFTPLSSTTFVATSDPSQSKYRAATLARNTFLNDYSDVFGVAWWMLNRFATPELYVQTVIVDAAPNSVRWPFVLGIEVGDIVIINRRQMANTPPISTRCRVYQVTPDIGPFHAEWTLVIAPAPGPVAILNDPVYGIVGQNMVGA